MKIERFEDIRAWQQARELATTTKKSINAFIAYLRKSKRGPTKSP